MADANAHAPIVVAHMLGDRAQTIVTGNTSANLYPHFAGRQINFVMERRHVTKREFVKMHCFGDRATGFVHIGPWQQQERTHTGNRARAGNALKAPAPRPGAVALRDRLDRHEPDVVAVARVALSWIT